MVHRYPQASMIKDSARELTLSDEETAAFEQEKESLREVGRMSIHLKDITNAVQNEPKLATVESGGARRDNIYKGVKEGSYI
ncbi:hypothetical protein NDU88_003430 [Pleurodeles waltl]|uniref:Uncharacterized protein n=1 Tax=Pleurodeles waltl TaxID=8319 RepID=A0AAV7LFB1_PLEWA|nr:hypothetical protein NDU88_003430 [Pleurodeles waltl]